MSPSSDFDALMSREQERARLARRLHDSLSQTMTALSASAYMLPADAAGVPRLQSMIQQMLQEYRFLMSESAPPHGTDLVDAIRVWAEMVQNRFGMTTHIDAPKVMPDLPAPLLVGLYRVAQECMLNAARHAGVREVRLSIQRDTDCISLWIRDMGHGFVFVENFKESGLGFIQFIAKMLSADLVIKSEVGVGTSIGLRVAFP